VNTAYVRSIDGKWFTLELNGTLSIDSSSFRRRFERGLEAERLHRVSNKTWYVVVYKAGTSLPQGREVTLDQAMDWIAGNVSLREELLRRIFRGSPVRLPDAASTPTPAHGGDFVVKCLHCRRVERSLKACKNAKLKRILQVLQKAPGPLSAAEIAARGQIKNDASLRTYLAAMVAFGHVIKIKGRTGYVLASRPMS